VQARFALSEARLGSLLFLIAVGAVLMMLVSGGLIQRFGSHRVSLAGSLVYAVSLPGLFLAPSVAGLGLALLMSGAGGGALDVAMNDQAVLVQRRYPRPIMSSFHALFSIGGLAGAGAGALVLRLSGTPAQHALGAGALVAGISLATFRHLVREEAGGDAALLGLSLDRRLAPLCGLIFVCFMSEGIVADWSGLYLRDHVGASDSVAPLAFAAFSLTMTTGRFLGDRIVHRFGQAATALGGGLLATGGTAVALTATSPGLAILGFLSIGAGLSNLVPMIFTKAGNLRGLPSSSGLATVCVAGYGAFLAGPPLVGYLAELTSLPRALTVLGLFGLAVAASARGFVPEVASTETVRASGQESRDDT
jgi:Na+/melibiose symporter-like transporter